MRRHRSYQISSHSNYKNALLDWSKDHEIVAWMDSNEHHDKYSSYDVLLAIARQTDKSVFEAKSIDDVQKTIDKEKDWLFGYISYDIKNETEELHSKNIDGLDFPELYFFRPEKIIYIKDGKLIFSYLEELQHEIDDDYLQIRSLFHSKNTKSHLTESVRIKMRIHKDGYFEKANKFLDHIHRGDIYEANFCQEFYAEETTIDPLETYKNLNRISEPPFATYLRIGDKYLLCASPERYLKKEGQTLVSQPIKGTAARGESTLQDEELKHKLENDAKERAENIMITDLVRNDLSKSALKGSVKVEELCKVHSFKQVHQMISTITAKVPKSKKPLDLIKETFPMGSMTGAPKISAMKIIEDLEETKRGLYSGTVGYIDPEGNFDFNVVIRSILYNDSRKYVSFSVGSAITSKSNPESEYQECLLKAKAMRSVLETSKA
ncbi:anthranilate synthase component I family protein [Flagellimonas sp. S3867]|uniref:anthranilate synthase component I family protein n=1 Tax=Flagellimonas sp. S3867 TaxID=2768063 RepID=UPI001CC26606|nr:anthranilate synthase component I family protein [Flagellimonas sp. S3867]